MSDQTTPLANGEKTSETEASAPKPSMRVRLLIGEAVGLLTLLNIAFIYIPLRPTQIAALSIFFIVIWTIGWLGRKRFVVISLTVLIGISAVLAFALAYLWSTRESKLDEWQRVVSESVKTCVDSNAACIAECMSHPYPSSQTRSTSVSTTLSEDLVAGSFFLQNDAIQRMLDTKFGIGPRFLGTGFAQPVDSEEYKQARVPEYLCPNSDESADNVITWQLSPTNEFLEWTIEEIITGTRSETNAKGIVGTKAIKPTNSEDKLERYLPTIQSSRDLGSSLPAVVRFQQLVCSSGTVGRSQATRVFFSHLGAVWNMKLRDAARFSGYTLDPAENKKFYIWVFLPTHSWDVVPATWHEILIHIKDGRNSWIPRQTQKP